MSMSIRLKFVDEKNYIDVCGEEGRKKGTIGDVGGEMLDLDPDTYQYLVERSETVNAPLARRAAQSRSRIDANKMLANRERLKKVRAEVRTETLELRRERAAAQGRRPGSIDWGEFDQLGKPAVSFDPNHRLRRAALQILQRPVRDRTRSALAAKLGVEFSRIYERYRKAVQIRAGATYSFYTVSEREQKYCQEAGVNCVLRGVTPRKLLEYWDKHIGDFTHGDLLIPPLSFLKSPHNIDRVATSDLVATRSADQQKDRPLRPTDRNTFSGYGGLDTMLRPCLEAGGFQTQAYNDRFLLTIQHNALSIARGRSIFLAEGIIRKMVLYVSKTLYQSKT